VAAESQLVCDAQSLPWAWGQFAAVVAVPSLRLYAVPEHVLTTAPALAQLL